MPRLHPLILCKGLYRSVRRARVAFQLAVVSCAFLILAPAEESDSELMLPTGEEIAHLHRINVARRDPPSWCVPLRPRDGMPLPGCAPTVDWDMYTDEVSVIEPAPPVGFDPLLLAAARDHAQYLAHHQFVGHYQEEEKKYFTGVTPADRAKAVGWSGRGLGENAGGPGGDHEGLLTAFIVDWERPNFPSTGGMQDPRGHRDALFNPAWQALGPGVVIDDSGERSRIWVVHEFAVTVHPRWFSVIIWEDANGNGLYDADEGMDNCQLRLRNSEGELVLDLPVFDTGFLSLPMSDVQALTGSVERQDADGEWQVLAEFEADEGESALWWEVNIPPQKRITSLRKLLDKAARKDPTDVAFAAELMLASWGLDVSRGIGGEVSKEIGQRAEAAAEATLMMLKVDAQLAEGRWLDPLPSVLERPLKDSALEKYQETAQEIAQAGAAIEPMVKAARDRTPIESRKVRAARSAEKRMDKAAGHPALSRHARRLRDLMQVIGKGE